MGQQVLLRLCRYISLLEQESSPSMGDVLVTGATGGVGSVAVSILSKLGFNVVGATGKMEEEDMLLRLGAKR